MKFKMMEFRVRYVSFFSTHQIYSAPRMLTTNRSPWSPAPQSPTRLLLPLLPPATISISESPSSEAKEMPTGSPSGLVTCLNRTFFKVQLSLTDHDINALIARQQRQLFYLVFFKIVLYLYFNLGNKQGFYST